MKQDEKLTLCQTQEEWERFNNLYKQGYYPDTQVHIVTTSGTSYTTLDKDTKMIEVDL